MKTFTAPGPSWRKQRASRGRLGACGVLVFIFALGCSPVAAFFPAQTSFTHDLTGNRISQAAAALPIAPTIIAQPIAQLGRVGSPVSFTVIASGTAPLSYQWYEGTTAISGATSSTLVLANPQAADFTNHATTTPLYSVNVTGATTVTSTAVPLDLDTDGEGIPDWWQLQYFSAIGVAPLADADGDGVSNLQEYLDGTNPTDATSHNFTLTVTGPVLVSPLMATYPPGTTVTLSVPGDPNAAFQNWSGDAGGSQNPLTVVMNANKNITAETNASVTPGSAPILSAGGAGAQVGSVLVEGNGQILVAGSYHTLNGRPQWVLGRLNSDGSLDSSFFAGAGSELPFYSAGIAGAADMVQQTDGKIVLVGFFDSGNSTVSIPAGIYRVNSDGSLDTTYVAATSTYVQAFSNGFAEVAQITAVALQSDGKVLIGGNFAQVAGVARAGIARLNTDGSLDTTFNPGTGFAVQSGNNNGPLVSPRCLKVAANGQIYVGGTFGTYNGVSTPGVARLNTDGTLDTTFAIGTGDGSTGTSVVNSILVRPTGGLLVGGTFTNFNGTTVPHLIALTTTGAIDSSVSAPTDISGPTAMAFQSNGKILVTNSGFSENTFLRLNANGAIDSTFSCTVGGNRAIESIAVQTNGQIVIGGNFNDVDNVTQFNIARVNADGSLDTTAVMNAGALNQGATGGQPPTCFAEEFDGKMLVGGGFTLFDNTPVPYFVRLNADSSLDTTFNVGGDGFDGAVKSVIQTPGNKIFVAGAFGSYDDTSAAGFVQLNTDGSIDPNFAPGTGGSVSAAALQPDGKILLFGNLSGGKQLERLNTDGTIDSTFLISVNAPSLNGTVSAVVVQPDGRILVGGSFKEVNGQVVGNGTDPAALVRLNSDGTLDTTFNATVINNANFSVMLMAVSPNGQLLVHTSINGLQRLNSDGSQDTSYNPPFGAYVASETITALAVLPDGSALLGGSFVFGNMSPYGPTNFLKLMPSGAIDSTLAPGFNGAAVAFLPRSNGEVYIGGNFTSDAAQNAVGIVRFSSSANFVLSPVSVSVASPVSPGTPETLTATATTLNGQVASLVFQSSTDGVNFTTIAQGTLTSGNQWTGSWTPATTGSYYLRTMAVDSFQNIGDSVAIFNFDVSTNAVSPVQISTQPQNQTVSLGSTATFSVVATGSNLTYQWQFNNADLTGQNDSTLTLTGVTQAQGGNYDVVVGNSSGMVTSTAATLTVQATYSQWATSHGYSDTTLTDTPSNDGLSNLFKYFFDIAPGHVASATDRAALPTLGTTPNGNFLTLTYRENSLLMGLAVQAEVSADLKTWQPAANAPVEISVDPATDDATMQVQVPITGTKQFLRLDIVSP